jgi:hypothetical protein
MQTPRLPLDRELTTDKSTKRRSLVFKHGSCLYSVQPHREILPPVTSTAGERRRSSGLRKRWRCQTSIARMPSRMAQAGGHWDPVCARLVHSLFFPLTHVAQICMSQDTLVLTRKTQVGVTTDLLQVLLAAGTARVLVTLESKANASQTSEVILRAPNKLVPPSASAASPPQHPHGWACFLIDLQLFSVQRCVHHSLSEFDRSQPHTSAE